MARSPIPLLQWFDAIRWLLWRPTISTPELAARTRIQRPTTLRAVAFKIREAMSAEDASGQLAGLDLHFARPAQSLSQVCVKDEFLGGPDSS